MNITNLSALMTNASAPLQHLVERAEAELNFAEQLCELHPGNAETWRPLIQTARAAMAGTLAKGRLDEIPDAVRAVEARLAPIGQVAKSYTVHCVGPRAHRHELDVVVAGNGGGHVDTFTTVLRLMDEYPDFRFSQSQASIYQIIERHRPGSA